jgi:hypothetical protein
MLSSDTMKYIATANSANHANCMVISGTPEPYAHPNNG